MNSGWMGPSEIVFPTYVAMFFAALPMTTCLIGLTA
jgi:hypothetical protein